MHLRRALLLFAIVLGLAAIAASVSRPPDEPAERAESPPPPVTERQETPSVSPGSTTVSEAAVELTFDAARPRTRRLDTGVSAAVIVEVDDPGLVEIPGLGRSAPANPLTPARFDLLVADPGRFEITHTPAAEDEPEEAGTLAVEEAAEE